MLQQVDSSWWPPAVNGHPRDQLALTDIIYHLLYLYIHTIYITIWDILKHLGKSKTCLFGMDTGPPGGVPAALGCQRGLPGTGQSRWSHDINSNQINKGALSAIWLWLTSMNWSSGWQPPQKYSPTSKTTPFSPVSEKFGHGHSAIKRHS